MYAPALIDGSAIGAVGQFAALRWLQRASLPVTSMGEPAIVRSALDALALRLDGRQAALTTARRRRSIFYNILQYAVELEALAANPVDRSGCGRKGGRSPNRSTGGWWSTAVRPGSC